MSEILKTETQSTTLRQKLQAKYGKVSDRPALLLDISGSMAGDRIAKLREFAREFKDIQRFVYSSGCSEIGSEETIPEPYGSTNLALAFITAKGSDFNHVVVITDGGADSRDDARSASVGLRVDCIYVGDGDAPPILKELALATGGLLGKSSLNSLKAITTQVRGLLGDGKGVIAL